MKILICLFLQRGNFGDDLFQIAYEGVVKTKLKELYPASEIDLILVDPEKIEKIPNEIDAVVFGGGDMLVDYFIDRLKKLLKQSPEFHGTVFGLSVGLPYASVLERGSLDMFDNLCVRSREDQLLIATRFPPENVHFLPDLATSLPWKRKTIEPAFAPSSVQDLKTIGICFAYDLVREQQLFEKVTTKLFKGIRKIIKRNKTVKFYWIPFHHSKDEKSNDSNIVTDVKKFFTAEEYEQFVIVEPEIDFQKMNQLFDSIELFICGRFHAHIICIATNTPFISIAESPKVRKLLKETKTELASTENGKFYSTLRGVVKNYSAIQGVLQATTNDWNDCLTGYGKLLFQFASNRRRKPPQYISDVERSNLFEWMTVKIIHSIDQKQLAIADKAFCVKELLKGGITFYSLFSHLTENARDEVKRYLSETICFLLTGKRNADYAWGLSQQILEPTFNFKAAFDWLHKDFYANKSHRTTNLSTNSNRKFWSIQWFENDQYKGIHRSGWDYVVHHLSLNSVPLPIGKNPQHIPEKTELILDTYCDRTFGWENQYFVALDIVPYQKPWAGFFHHTFDQQFDNNVKKSCNLPSFIASLKTCKALLVLSNKLKCDLENELTIVAEEHNLDYVPPVFSFYHPTELDVEGFSLAKFIQNPNKKLVQIGAWLRNPFGIYNVPIDFDSETKKGYRNDIGIHKAVLKGPQMESYFRPDEFHLIGKRNETTNKHSIKVDFCKCQCKCETDEDRQKRFLSNKLCECEQMSFYNDHIKWMLKSIQQTFDSVEILEKLPNLEYDQLLVENIVFLNLVDCSAVNTVIECIARSTPILVNPLPAVVECLGKEYPFYYESFREAADKATDLKLIETTHNYLKMLPKEFLDVNFFLDNVRKTLENELNNGSSNSTNARRKRYSHQCEYKC